MTSSASGPSAQHSPATARETNLWDTLTALIVVGALVALVIYLVSKYGSDTEKVTSVLGVAAPVLAAGFGVTLGYFTGQTKGQAAGRDEGRAQVKEAIRSRLDALEAAAAPDAGTSFAPGQGGAVDPEAALHQIRGIVDAP